MECAQVGERLRDYLDDSIDPVSRITIEQHWEYCASCRNEAESLLSIWGDLECIAVPAPSADSRARFDTMLASYQLGLSDGERSPRSNRSWGAARRGLEHLRQPLALAIGGLLLLVTGFVVGGRLPDSQPVNGLADLESEVRSLKQLVALSMLEQQSASQRLRGVSWTAQMGEPNGEVVNSLLDTLDSDTSLNVRLAVVEVLRGLGDDSGVREHLMQSLPRQRSPLVQVSIIGVLVEAGEVRAVPVLEQLSNSESVHAAVRQRALWGLSELG